MSDHLVANDLATVRDVSVQLRARGRGLRRGQVHALVDVDFSVAPGEIVGVVGESGCGKSTLARVLVGLQKPTTGTVSYRSGHADGASPSRSELGKRVGVVFQDPSTALNPRLSVGRTVLDPLDVHRVGTPADRDRRVKELLDLVGLPLSVIDALPRQISGGQRQRVAIARALALQPELLVADEPTSALDVSVRGQILNLINDLRSELGLAVVIISHDLQTVRYLADRICVMYLGRIVEHGPTDQVTRQTRHPYTRALLSATPSLLTHTERIVLEGPVPSATEPPSGCPFRTRCWLADARCAEAFPADATEGDHHWSCHHALVPAAGAHQP